MIRLFTTLSLTAQSPVPLTLPQTHYLLHVMRLKAGDEFLLFNGRDGEWLSALSLPSKKAALALPLSCMRQQALEPGPLLYFPPLKKEPLAFLIQKATELGASALCPVLTERASHPHLKSDRLSAIAIEAAEQSRRLTLPAILPATSLKDIKKPFYFLDESGKSPLISTLSVSKTGAFVFGPEGGFSDKEFSFLRTNGTGLSLGPLTLRAETAGLCLLSYLSCLQ